MKRIFVLMASFLVILAISCKEDDPEPTFDPVGFWKGKWSNTGPATPPNLQYLWLLIRADGTMRIYYDATDTTGSNKSSGTWTKPNDSTINWSAPDWGELATAKIRNNSTKMVGTWGLTPSYTDEGQLEVDRQ